MEEALPPELARRLSRRDLLKAGAMGTVGLATAGGAFALQGPSVPQVQGAGGHISSHHDMVAIGELRAGGFDPTKYLTHFDTGRVSRLPSGQVFREYELVAVEREIEVVPGVFYPAWTYNGQVPGPTLRCTEGDRVRVRVLNVGAYGHTIHFRGVHPADMVGWFEIVQLGASYSCEFDAELFVLHFYHC